MEGERPDFDETMPQDDAHGIIGKMGTFKVDDMFGKARLLDKIVHEPSGAGDARAAAALKKMGGAKFQRYVLYVQEGHPVCDKVLHLLKQRPRLKMQTHIEDVDALIASLGHVPQFITDVPMLIERGRVIIDKTTKKPRKETTRGFLGESLLMKIASWQSDEPIARMGKRLTRQTRQGFSNGVKGTNGALFSTMGFHDVKIPPEVERAEKHARKQLVAQLRKSDGGSVPDGVAQHWEKSR